MLPPTEPRDDQWHLDRRVPIAIVITILIQTFGFTAVATYWKSDVDHRLAALEKFEDAAAATSPVSSNRLTILEQNFSFISQTLNRIEGKLNDLEKKSP